MDANSTIFTSVAPAFGTQVALRGIDFGNITFGDVAFRSPGFYVGPGGQVVTGGTPTAGYTWTSRNGAPGYFDWYDPIGTDIRLFNSVMGQDIFAIGEHGEVNAPGLVNAPVSGVSSLCTDGVGTLYKNSSCGPGAAGTASCKNFVGLGGHNDGVTDNTPIYNANIGGTGCLYFPPGKYRFNSTPNAWFTTAATDTISIIGEGSDVTTLYFPTVGIGINISVQSVKNSIHLRNFSLTTGTNGTPGGFAINMYSNTNDIIPAYVALSEIVGVTVRGEDGYCPNNTCPGTNWAAGAIGPRGLQGVQGLQGVAGSTGPAGPIGPPGATGPAGPQGPQGPQGPAGTIGSILSTPNTWTALQTFAAGINSTSYTLGNITAPAAAVVNIDATTTRTTDFTTPSFNFNDLSMAGASFSNGINHVGFAINGNKQPTTAVPNGTGGYTSLFVNQYCMGVSPTAFCGSTEMQTIAKFNNLGSQNGGTIWASNPVVIVDAATACQFPPCGVMNINSVLGQEIDLVLNQAASIKEALRIADLSSGAGLWGDATAVAG
jgi:hypothetical protein